MASPISPFALSYVRSRATDAMTYYCRIERVLPPSYDETTLVASSGDRDEIYEGICRIWEITGPGVIMLGEDEYSTQSTQLSIPWNSQPVPQRHDEGVVLESELDSSLIGKRFVIFDVVKSGSLRATRRFTVQFKQDG